MPVVVATSVILVVYSQFGTKYAKLIQPQASSKHVCFSAHPTNHGRRVGDSVRFRIYKSGAVWIFAAMDMLVGQIPLATSDNWLTLTLVADQVSVNYRLQSLSHC